MNSHLLKKTLVVIMTSLFLVSAGAMSATTTNCKAGYHWSKVQNKCVKNTTTTK
jgi:hypothetical protein